MKTKTSPIADRVAAEKLWKKLRSSTKLPKRTILSLHDTEATLLKYDILHVQCRGAAARLVGESLVEQNLNAIAASLGYPEVCVWLESVPGEGR